MTPHELVQKLVAITGPCQGMRVCVYCPEQLDAAEVKECVEGMYKTIYKLQADKDLLLEDLLKIRRAYKELSGHEYQDTED